MGELVVANPIDEMSNKYGKLTVIERAERPPGLKDTLAYWLCRCECGGGTVVAGHYLRKGHTQSCGCSRYDWNRLPPGEASFRALLSNMRARAEKRGFVWHLTRDEVRRLTGENCFYCGAPPAQTLRRSRYPLNGDYIYNGLDRIDNDEGYVLDNVVPCCKTCNFAKRAMTQAEFYDWMDHLCKYRSELCRDH